MCKILETVQTNYSISTAFYDHLVLPGDKDLNVSMATATSLTQHISFKVLCKGGIKAKKKEGK